LRLTSSPRRSIKVDKFIFFSVASCHFICSLGFTIEYRFVSHAETYAQSQNVKPRFVAGGSLPDNNIIGAGVLAQLSGWPYFSSLFFVCPQAEALAAGAAITVNINQV
jgi:hypothetical protein